jgi:UDP-N-acetylglucosamine 2-epimerase (non-hydrolysing)
VTLTRGNWLLEVLRFVLKEKESGMRKLPIVSVVGARPNFMKMAPLLRELMKYPAFDSRLVHTGQHYDTSMSQVFFRDLKMPSPDFNLLVGSGTHAAQTGEVMKRFEEVCERIKPELVIVAGDVNSTLACSLTAAKLQIPVAHVESGLRSFDRTMPEEINRMVTDLMSDYLFTTEESGNRNLRHEGTAEEKIHFVGNTMIDSLVSCYPYIERPTADSIGHSTNGTPYFLATIHRPSNVDEPAQLLRVIEIFEAASRLAPVVFVTHPRTLERLGTLNHGDKLIDVTRNGHKIERGFIYLMPPLPYLEFLRLMAKSRAVLTDSGGIQEETTFLEIPCLTLRENTERPVTIELGSNEIVGLDSARILTSLEEILLGRRTKNAIKPPLWDGAAAQRIVRVLRRAYGLLG